MAIYFRPGLNFNWKIMATSAHGKNSRIRITPAEI